MNVEQSAIENTPLDAVQDHELPGPWRIIVARRRDGCARTWFYSTHDHPRLPSLLRQYADAYVKNAKTEDD